MAQKLQNPKGQVARWLERLYEFEFAIDHRIISLLPGFSVVSVYARGGEIGGEGRACPHVSSWAVSRCTAGRGGLRRDS